MNASDLRSQLGALSPDSIVVVRGPHGLGYKRATVDETFAHRDLLTGELDTITDIGAPPVNKERVSILLFSRD